MGSRSSFRNVGSKNFEFVDNGQTFITVGSFENVQILIKERGSVKAPEFSHTENRIYAVTQNGALKHLSFYDENHNQAVAIDLLHSHRGLQPHKHLYLDHSDNGIPISSEERNLIEKIKREFHLR